jgi:hypothetical protein
MDEKAGYIEKLSAQIVEWDVQIDRLRDQAENVTPDAKFEYSQMMAALQLKRDQAALELQGLLAASDDEWEELKDGAERIWSEVRTILTDTIEKMR